MALEEIKKARLEKLSRLREAGVDPYPSESRRTHEIGVVLAGFEALAGTGKNLTIAGRIMAKREHGGSAFMDIIDASGKIQVLFKKDNLGEKDYGFLLETTDIGDFMEVGGRPFRTRKNEPTVEAKEYRLLAKSLRPLPEKWHGLQNIEERYRKRYLDLIFNEGVKDKFKTRSEIVQILRSFMLKNDFMEVVTPTLQPLYGGASARPFKTHLHDLDTDFYLRVAPELYLKRLLVGGFERVFEFTTNFRNEGMDKEHNPEFSVLEFYAAYKDLNWLMGFTEDIFENLLANVFGRTEIKYENKTVDFKKPYRRAKFNDLLKKYSGFGYEDDEENFRKKTKALGIRIEKAVSKPVLADELFKKVIGPELVAPIFVTDWPAEILPLARRTGDSEFVGAFQFFAGGHELIKAFQELNDPIEQRERFKSQELRRAKGDEEAQRMDEDFIEALEYGLPPAAGWGLGIDRLVALLTDSHALREIILFPLMRPPSR